LLVPHAAPEVPLTIFKFDKAGVIRVTIHYCIRNPGPVQKLRQGGWQMNGVFPFEPLEKANL
jgi:hypothetical protein